MIQTIYSNSYELLRRILLGYVTADRKTALKMGQSSVFTSDTIVIPSEAIKDDIARAFADEIGIASNLNLVSFSHWFGESSGPRLMGRGNTAEELEWIIWSLLTDADFLNQPQCQRLASYLKNQPPSAVTTLARRITHLFVTYVSYRLDWVLDWMNIGYKTSDKPTPRLLREKKALEAHLDFPWQKALFEEIAKRQWGENKLSWSSTYPLFQVPKRWKELLEENVEVQKSPVHIFLPAALPPLSLPFLQALAKSRDIFIYLINPSEAYWFETLPRSVFDDWKMSESSDALDYLRKNAASQRALIERIWTFAGDPETDPSLIEDDAADRTDATVHGRKWDVTPELDLSALETLRVSDVAHQEQTTAFVHHPECTTVLQQVQEAILTDSASDLPSEVAPDDDSFLIVKAPNAAREIEAVLDWVDGLRQKAEENGEKFGAEDVLVVTPDIDAMAPVITSVLMNRPAENKMAYHIAGQSQIAVNSTAQAILAAGRFVFSKATRKDFEALLEYPILFRSWGCDEALTGVIRTWLVSGGYRWGLDAEHAQACVDNLSAQDEGGDFDGTLERALERLNLGARMRSDRKEVFAETLPAYGNEAGGFDTVDKYKDLFDFLCSVSAGLTDLSRVPRKQSASQWLAWTQKLIADVFPQAVGQPDVASFTATAERVQEAVHAVMVDAEIPFEAFWGAISATLQTDKTMARASGRITFAGMEDFRWLPFKAIAVVGLNDGPTFPGVVRSEEFDLMTAEVTLEDGQKVNARRKGDRDSRRNNRNVFLDLMLSCRQNFLISYTAGTGSVEASPSVVVQDVKALLSQGFGDESVVEKMLTVKLPASVFAEENFTSVSKSVQSRNQMRLGALLEARQVNFLAHEKQFLNAQIVPAQDESGAGRSIPLREIARAVIDPDDWASRALGVNILEKDEEADVPLVSPLDDALVRSITQGDILKRLEQGVSAQDILHTYGFDPGMGVKVTREISVAELVNKLNAAHELQQRLKEAAASSYQLQSKFFLAGNEIAEPAFEKAALPAIDVYCFGSNQTPTSLFIGKSGRDIKRALIQFLAQSAVHGIRDMYFVNLKETPAELEHWHLDNDSLPGFAQKAMSLLMVIVNRFAKGPMVMGTPVFWSDDSLKFKAIWTGDDSRGELCDETQKLQNALEALRGVFVKKLTEEEKKLLGTEIVEGVPDVKTTGRGKSAKPVPHTTITQAFIDAAKLWETK
ncbi:MAG: exodeoxyribonuclease V subunit gamma [Sutterellaceae bacterium]|nr:exodeoxyribonuclease V subunit gamma [Sutterellaceae bacterium]